MSTTHEEFDRDLTSASRREIRSDAPALEDAQETLKHVNAVAARVIDMADRLCGPAPTAGQKGGLADVPPNGELGRLRADMRDTRQAIIYAGEALSRIERELIG